MKEYFVYLLRFQDGSYYTGMTNNIERRMGQHRSHIHKESYVSKKGSFYIVHQESFREVTDAIRREKQIQAWSRKKKDALVAGNENLLHNYSKKNIQIMPRYVFCAQKTLGMTLLHAYSFKTKTVFVVTPKIVDSKDITSNY